MHASLKHPNIIQAYLGMEDKAGVRLFMEYAGDSDAYSYINAKQRLSLREDDALQLVFDVLTALQYMHSQVGLSRTELPAAQHTSTKPCSCVARPLFVRSCNAACSLARHTGSIVLHHEQPGCPAAAMDQHHTASLSATTRGTVAWWGWV